MVSRPVLEKLRLTIVAGAARPVPPVGPTLGQNAMAFCKEFNLRTQKYKPDAPMTVFLTAFKDNTFEFTVRSPPVSWYLKRAAVIKPESGRPDTSTITLTQVAEIAKIKMQDPHCQKIPLDTVCKSIIGTASSMGIKLLRATSLKDAFGR